MKLHALRNFGTLDYRCLAYTPAGESLVVAAASKLRVWDWVRDWEHIVCDAIFHEHPQFLSVSADGRWLLQGGELWNLETGQLEVRFDCDHSGFLSNPPGVLGVSGTDISQWELQPPWTGQRLLVLPANALALEVAQRGDLIAVHTYDQSRRDGMGPEVYVIDLAARQSRFRIPCPLEISNRVAAFSPDSQLLAFTWVEDVLLYATATMAPGRRLSGHTGLVSDLRFHPAGEVLLSSGCDGTVHVWDVQTAALRDVFDFGIGPVYCLDIAPDGMTAAAAGDTGQIVVWDLDL